MSNGSLRTVRKIGPPLARWTSATYSYELRSWPVSGSGGTVESCFAATIVASPGSQLCPNIEVVPSFLARSLEVS